MQDDDYWDRVIETLKSFWQPGDTLRCVHVYRKRDSWCQMCGHSPITRNFVLRNETTGQTLIVGSECIDNYKTIAGQAIELPPTGSATEAFDERYPDCEQVDVSPGPFDFGRLEDEFDEREPAPRLEDLVAEGLDPDEIDWDSQDYDPD